MMAVNMVPWYANLIERDQALMGRDWWPYGVKANRGAVAYAEDHENVISR